MNSYTLAVRADSPLITHENSNQSQSFYQCQQQRGNPCIGKHVDQKCLQGQTSPNSRNSLACDRPTIFRVSTTYQIVFLSNLIISKFVFNGQNVAFISRGCVFALVNEKRFYDDFHILHISKAFILSQFQLMFLTQRHYIHN